MRVELPGGQWADLRDPDAVTQRQRAPLMSAMGRLSKQEDADDGGIGSMSEVSESLMLTFVTAWSFPSEVSADSVADLPAKTFDALAAVCMPLMQQVLPNFAPSPEPASPTGPSVA